MRIAEIDNKTEGTFFHCLHDELPDDPRVIAIRRDWYNKLKPKGLRGKVLTAENDDVVGLCQYLPIEYSPFEGKDLMAILCMWIHGYEHHVGNQQGRGYGRFMLEYIEEDARSSGMKGVVVWGKDFPFWNPVSFYEHMGYSRVDKDGQDVLVWKPFEPNATSPTIRRIPPPMPGRKGKVAVTVHQYGWCWGDIAECLNAKEAVEEIGDIAEYSQIDISLSHCILRKFYLDRMLYKPDGPPAKIEEMRDDIIKLYNAKNGHQHHKSREEGT
jgi:N-acetylglutamate synthase-like GNAT family acetyltransferase